MNKNKFYIEDITSLGKNINHISKALIEIFNTYDVIEIKDLGIFDSSNKEFLLMGVNLIVGANAKIWSNGKKPKEKRPMGRARALSQEQENELVDLILSGTKRADIMDMFKISESTLARILRRRNIKRGKMQNA